jgi:hypothetical protein
MLKFALDVDVMFLIHLFGATLTLSPLLRLSHRSHSLSNRNRALPIVKKPLWRTLPKKPRLPLLLLTVLLLPTLTCSRT